MIYWEVVERHKKHAYKAGFIDGFLLGVSVISIVVILNIFFWSK